MEKTVSNLHPHFQIAPILTRGSEMLIQSIFYPFEMFSSRREGISLRPALQGPNYQSQTCGTVPFIDSSVLLSGDRLHPFTVNRSPSESAPVQVQLAGRSIMALENGELPPLCGAATTWRLE